MDRVLPSFCLAALILGACGDDALRRPVDLVGSTFPANEAFTLSLTMARCRQSCETVGERSCSVNVKTDERVIEVSAEVQLEVADGATCSGNCGGASVLAHCDIDPLEAGRWVVSSNGGAFERTIQLVSR